MVLKLDDTAKKNHFYFIIPKTVRWKMVREQETRHLPPELFKNCFSTTDIYGVTSQMCAQTHLGIHVKCFVFKTVTCRQIFAEHFVFPEFFHLGRRTVKLTEVMDLIHTSLQLFINDVIDDSTLRRIPLFCDFNAKARTRSDVGPCPLPRVPALTVRGRNDVMPS